MLKRFLLALLMLTLVSCGDANMSTTKETRFNGEAFSNLPGNFEGELPERPRLNFRSEQQTVHVGSLELALKLGWAMLGIEAEIGHTVRTAAASLLDVSKTALTANSRIFRDSEGHFDVNAEEPIMGHCEYALGAQLQFGGEAEITVAGVRAGQEHAQSNLLEVTVGDQFFAIEADKTLADYEQICRQGFAAFEKSMRDDLTAALRSKVVINKVGDSRVDALEKALLGESARFQANDRTWELTELTVLDTGNSISVSGQLQKLGRFSGETYEFSHSFLRGDLKLLTTDLRPRDVDVAVLELSMFFAKHAAVKAATKQQVLRVDTSLLR